MSDEKRDTSRSRTSIIDAVKTPLGFFTLTVLIVEGILGLLASRATGRDFSVLLGAMIILIFVLVACIIFIVMRRPQLLFGIDVAVADERRTMTEEIRQAQAEAQASNLALAQCQQESHKLQQSNLELSAKLNRLDSLRNRTWVLLHHSDSVSLDFILKELRGSADDESRDQVLAVMGALIDEGKVEPAFNSGYYKATKRQ